ncbi:MAG: hypothetical protein ABIH78_04200 [Candidatus Peregrinibacteria bacterium]
MDLSAIKNEKLKALVSASKSFAALTPDQQERQIKLLAALPEEKSAEVIAFLTEENEKEVAAEASQFKLLKKLYNRVLEMKKDFEHLLKKDAETLDQQKEKSQMSTLLNKLK